MLKNKVYKEIEFKLPLCYLLAAGMAGFLFVTIIAVSNALPGGRRVFAYGDALYQTAMFSKMFIRHLFSGETLDYSFELSLGMPTSAVYAFYAQSPLNIVYAFVGDLNTATFIITMLKVMISAVTMCFFLRHSIGLSGLEYIVLSTAYSLCGYVVNFYVALDFLDVMYLFPIIIHNIKKYIETSKWNGLCMVYAVSFMIQFYCAYIMGVLSFVMFISYGWYIFNNDWNKWSKNLIKYFICVFLAIAISAPVVLPAGIELFTYRMEDVTQFEKHILPLNDFLSGLYPSGSQGVYNTIPFMYTGLPMLFLVMAFFTDKEVDNRKKIAMSIPLVAMLIFSFFGPAYRMIHAFDAPDGYDFRFSWAFSFWLVVVSALELKELKNKNRSWLFWSASSCLISAGYFVLLFMQNKIVSEREGLLSLEKGVVVLCLSLIYGFMFAKRYREIMLSIILVVEVFMNGWWTQMGMVGYFDKVNYQILMDQAEGGISYVKEMEKDKPAYFYRVNYTNSMTDNLSMFLNFHGVGGFSSILNGNSRHFLQQSGYAAKNLVLMDYGSTPLMRMLLGQKYSIQSSFYKTNNWEKYGVIENKRTLPLGYMVDRNIKDFQVETNNPFEYQNALLSSMLGDECIVYDNIEDAMSMEKNGVEFYVLDDGILAVKNVDDSDTASAVFNVTEDRKGAVYAYMSRWGEASTQQESAPRLYSNLDVGGMMHVSTAYLSHVIPLARNNKGIWQLFLQMQPGSDSEFDFEGLYFAYENNEMIDSSFDELISGGIRLTECSDDIISGLVDVKGDKKLLFTTIPYDECWNVYVDGKKEDIIPVINNAFCAVDMESGTHEVHFVFRSKWRQIGKAFGGAGFLVWIVLAVREYDLRKKILKNEKENL